jgi:hypothetical protein
MPSRKRSSRSSLLPFDEAVHEATFAELIGLVNASLTEAERVFLLGFEAGDPDWALFPVAGADRLLAPRWKLLNIERLRSRPCGVVRRLRERPAAAGRPRI